jgi:hypothetical protein
MANNKLIAAALAGLLATVSPLAAIAGEHEGKEANGCKGEANSCKGEAAPAAEAPKEGEANGCKGEAAPAAEAPKEGEANGCKGEAKEEGKAEEGAAH